jgi:signal transduction histidine kinase
LKFDTDAASIRVRDDGRGFQVRYPANNLNSQNGFGLLGIQERASLLGGKFEVRSTPGEGTDLLVWIPVSRRVVGDD